MNESIKIENLTEAVLEALEENEITKYNQRDILEMSLKFITRKREILVLLKKIFSDKFKNNFLELEKQLEKYENDEINIENTQNLENIIKSVYSDFNYTGSFNMSCLTVQNIKLIKNIIENNIKISEKLTNMLFPINKKIYFLDQRFNYFEFVCKKVLYKIFKKLLPNLKIFTKYCLLIYKKISSINNINSNLFYNDLKYIFEILKTFGLKNKILNSAKDLLIQEDISYLSNIKTEFNKILSYYKNQKIGFSIKFTNKIECSVLNIIYSEMDTAFISNQLKLLKDCGSIYFIFLKAGLKDKLLLIFSSLFIKSIKATDFDQFSDRCDKIKKILSIFNDKSFSDKYLSYFEHILDSLSNCVEIAGFVDESMKNINIGNFESILIVELIENSINPEIFLTELQNRLSMRLLHLRNKVVDLTVSIESADSHIKKEKNFLSNFRRMHSEKMTKMLNDVELFLNQKKNHVHGPMLMTMCKWPVFKHSDIYFGPETCITRFKTDYSALLKADRKNINWIDSLSTVSVLLFKKPVTLSLFQYSVILKFFNFGELYEFDNSEYLTYILPNIEVPEMYNSQFNVLLDDIIIKKENFYILNPLFLKSSYLNYEIEFQSAGFIEPNDLSYNSLALNEALVAKFLKKAKICGFSEIFSNFKNEINEDELLKTLERLREKEIIEFENDKFKYCP